MQKLKNLLLYVAMALFFCFPAYCGEVVIDNSSTQQILQSIAGSDVNSDSFHWVYNSDTGILTTYQENKIRTSDIIAKTAAYELTYADGSTKLISSDPNDGMVSMEHYDYTNAKGQPMTVIATHYSAEASAELMASLQSGGQIQIDHVMVVSINGGETWSAKFDAATGQMVLNDDWVKDNPYAAMIIAQSGGDGAFGKGEGEAFAFNTFGWANKEGWLTNFKKILKLHNGNLLEFTQEEWDLLFPPGETPPETPVSGPGTEFIKRSTTGIGDWDGDEDQKPGMCLGKVDYYNDSRNYNENGFHVGFADAFDSDGNGPGLIIPSSEKLLAGIRARTYAGTAAISFGTGEHDFEYTEFGYDYTEFRYELKPAETISGVQIPEHFELYDRRDWQRYWEAPGQTSPVTGTATRYANFFYISDLDMYDFKSAGVANDAYGSTEFKNDDQHCLEDVLPQEDGKGDPIGPVDSPDGISLRGDRPQYDVMVKCLGDSHVTGAAESAQSQSYEFPGGEEPEYPEHLTWGEINNVEKDDRFLGWFSSELYGEPYGEAGLPEFSAPQEGTVGIPDEAQAIADALMENWVGTGVDEDLSNEKHVKYMQGVTYYATTSTDALRLGYNSYQIVEETTKDVRFNSDESCFHRFTAREGKNGKWPSYLQSEITSAMNNMTSYITDVPENETYESTPAFGLQQVEIPANKKNGKYTTSRTGFEYEHVLYYTDTAPVTESGDYKQDYQLNEPIIVQTPVVAPVTLYDDPDQKNADGSQMVPTAYTGEEAERFNLPINTLPTEDGQPKGINDQSNRKSQHLYTGEGAGRDDNLVQLRLDETYWFKFDPMTHLKTQGYSDIEKAYSGKFDNTWSDGDIKFDKYVQAKYIHFPFAVAIYLGNDEKPTYFPAVNDENDPNYWIPIYKKGEGSANLEWTRFYIPSWALEGSYTGEESLQYRVESINVTDDSGTIHNGDDAEHELLNDTAFDESTGTLNSSGLKDATEEDNKLYIATYKLGVQVSGWVYDFQVVGINNRDAYDKDMPPELSGQWHDLYYPFAWNYEEKRGGDRNRLGGDVRYTEEAAYVRYTRSGEIAHEGDQVNHSVLSRNTSGTPRWSIKDTVIIDNTKSHKYKDSGTPPKGTEFAFSVKTMQNLWNDGDYLEITPTFWYQSDDGTTYTQNTGLHLYYNDETGSNAGVFIEYNSLKDQGNVKTVSLANEMFNGSYFDEDIDYTVKHPTYHEDEAKFTLDDIGPSEVTNRVNEFKMRQTASYTLSDIKLSSNLRVFSGSVDQYKVNLTMDKDDPSIQQLRGGILKDSADVTADVEGCIQPSIQTWYGIYTIPASLHVSLKDPSQINEYAKTHGGITDDDSNIWLTDGYLIVHFDIKTHNIEDPTKDLVYDGQYAHNQNMWEDQNQDTTAEVGTPGAGPDPDPGDPSNPSTPNIPDEENPNNPHYTPHNITVDYGDVIVVDLKESIDDWFKANLWTIQ